jgi:serine/threonine-protein kinase
MCLLRDGQSVRDTYEIERFLGEGAFAEVYRVRHRFLGRQAMKVFKAVGISVMEIEELLGEAQLLSRLGHPHIIRVFDANTVDLDRGKCGFFTMEYVTGGSLEAFWRAHRGRPMPVVDAVEIVRQVCLGLAVAHAETPPIIHRDIKPQNVLIQQREAGLHVRLSDFGLARRANPLTLLASAQGTLAFKAPEAFACAEGDSCAGDVWAVGCTLYILLTSEFPYPEALDSTSPFHRRFDRLVPPEQYNVRVDPKLSAIVSRALALDRGDRYRDGGEMLAELSRWHPVAVEALASDENPAGRMVAEALRLAQQGQFARAVTLLEAACGQSSRVREQHEYLLHLWRRGILM